MLTVAYHDNDYFKKIVKDIQRIDYIKPDEIPNIDLYMDQVTTFMDEHLKSSKRYEDDKLLTKTMINNYTKNNLLPPPDKKKYSKDHMLLLIFIYYFKNIISITDIKSLFEPLTEQYYNSDTELNLEYIYDKVFQLETEQIDVILKDILSKYNISKGVFPEEEDGFLNQFAFICMLSFDVYVKKSIIEKFIDQSVTNRKEDKSNVDSKKTSGREHKPHPTNKDINNKKA